MKLIKKNIAFIFLTAILYFAYFFTHPHNIFTAKSSKYAGVLGASTNLQLFEQPQDGRRPFINAIQNTQKTIDLEVYLLSDKQIISALIQAKTRGVMERIILEQHPFGGGSTNKKIQQFLLQAGVPVRWSDSSFALTHEKMLIIDGSAVFILNQNLSASSFTKNREFNIIDANSQDVRESEQQFTADWNSSQFTPSDPHLLVSPDTSRQGFMQLITRAARTIDIEMEIINDPGIIDALVQKAKTARIRIIMPDLNKVPSNKEAMEKLHQSGILVQTKQKPYIHAKVMILDNILAYIGSINFSTESIDQNREIGIVISQQDIVNKLEQDFESDWQTN